jgi:hypothetical protein
MMARTRKLHELISPLILPFKRGPVGHDNITKWTLR